MNKNFSRIIVKYLKVIILFFFSAVGLSYADGSCQYITGSSSVWEGRAPLLYSYYIENKGVKPYYADEKPQLAATSTIAVSENNNFIIVAPSSSSTSVLSYKVNRECKFDGPPSLFRVTKSDNDIVKSLIQKDGRLYALVEEESKPYLRSFQFDNTTGRINNDPRTQQERKLPENCSNIAYNQFELYPQIYVTCGNNIYSYNHDDINSKSKVYVFNNQLGKIKIYQGGLLFIINNRNKSVDAYNNYLLKADTTEVNLPIYSYKLFSIDIPRDFELTYNPLTNKTGPYALFITSDHILYFFTTMLDGNPATKGEMGFFNLEIFQPQIASSWSANKNYSQIAAAKSDFKLFLLEKTAAVPWQYVVLPNVDRSDFNILSYLTDAPNKRYNPTAMAVALAPLN